MLTGILSPRSLLSVEQPSAPLRDLFHPGQVFWGRVLERLGDATVALSAQGTVVRAHTSLPLAIGSRYQFLVQQTEPRIIFQLVNPESPSSVHLVRLWESYAATRSSLAEFLGVLATAGSSSSLKGTAGEALSWLHRLLPTLIGKNAGLPDPSWLATQLSSAGLFWEQKVARWLATQGAEGSLALVKGDLKGTLLALKQALTRKGTGQAGGDLEAKMIGALESVELQQKLNLLLEADRGPWFWVIPDMEGLGTVEIFVTRDGEKDAESGGSPTFRLRLRLSPSRLGPVEAVLGLHQHTISCQLCVGDEALARWIESFLPLLRSGLEACGYRISFLGCEAGTIEDPPPGLKAIGETCPSLFHLVV